MTSEAQAEHQNARTSSLDAIAERVERELAQLRDARPYLSSRIDRAAGLLVQQLSIAPRLRPIRVRTRGERARFLVNSLTEGGVTYSVDPRDWTCSCPDYHRRNAPCKHVLGTFVLWKAAKPRRARCADCGESFHPDRLLEVGEGEAEETLRPGERVCRICAPRHGLPVPAQRGCSACQGGWVHLTEEIVDTTTGELMVATNPVRCRKCLEKPASLEPTLTDEEMARWMAESDWRWASTYADSHPHWYVRLRDQDPERFHAAARTIWYLGWDRMYLGRPWRSLEIGDHYVWVYTLPKPGMAYPRDTSVINRAPRVHERQPGRGA